MYFANPTGAAVDEMIAGRLGYIDTPLQGNLRPEGVTWCADNGCFNDEKFNEQRWWNWLKKHAGDPRCIFATAPDVVGSAIATYGRSMPWLPKIRALGYPAAFVAQDAQEFWPTPWDHFDVLFVGGTTEWKLGPAARQLVAEARLRGKHAHMGRVNSLKRYRYAEAIGCDSVDGTFLTRGPDKNLRRMQRWFRDLEQRPALFDFREPA